MICKRRGKTCIVGNTTHLRFRLCRLAQAIVLLPLTLAAAPCTVFVAAREPSAVPPPVWLSRPRARGAAIGSASTRSDARLAIRAAPRCASAVGASTGSTARLGVEATGARFDTTRARFDLHGRALETAAMETVELGRHRSLTRRRGAPVVAAPSNGSDELD
jgi:hypothetical protein